MGTDRDLVSPRLIQAEYFFHQCFIMDGTSFDWWTYPIFCLRSTKVDVNEGHFAERSLHDPHK